MRIDLFSTKQGGKWLPTDSADVRALESGEIPDLVKKMMENRPIDPATTLKKVFGRSTGAVHILVRIRPPPKLTFTPMATWMPSAEESSHVLEFQLNVNRHVYTFISAVLRGEKECSGEMLAWRAEVEEILQTRQDSGAKPCVVFLDEFPQLGIRGGVCEAEFKYNAKLYSVMINNVFRALGLPVVVSSTNGTAHSLLEEGTLWNLDVGIAQTRACTVIPTLPSFAFDDEAIKQARVPGEIKDILQHSRPHFVELALEYVGRKQYDGTSRSDLLEYLSVMVGESAKKFQGMKKFARPKEFELGQIGLLLNETYPTAQNANMVDGHYALLMENKPFA